MELLAALLLAAPPPMDAPPPAEGEPAKVERPREGPEAVLEFERMFRGKANPDYKGCCHKDHGKGHAPRRDKKDEKYPEAKPIPLEGLKNIAPLSAELWRPADVLKDFEKTRGEGQEAVLVIVKTEFCHANEHRVCAAATAALEKLSTPVLKNFKVYGAWIKGGPNSRDPRQRDFDENVALAYRFEQGPGAKLVVLVPGVDRPFDASASELGLTVDDLEKNKGRTPRLERFLTDALETGRALKKAK